MGKISLEQQRAPRWWLGLGVSLVLLAAAGAWWLTGGDGASDQGPVSRVGGGLWSRLRAHDDVAAAASSVQAQAPVDDADTKALIASLGKRANARAEARRIVSYLGFQKGFNTWQNLDPDTEGARRKQMAKSLLAELPQRYKSGEFTALEATLMGTVLLADAESDSARRNELVTAWQSVVSSGIADPNDQSAMVAGARETEFMRRRATAYEQWQEQTDPAVRTPDKLAQAMAEVDRLYNSGATSSH